MDIRIVHGPGNSAARVGLAAGETVTAEGGAMIAMSGGLSVETTTKSRGGGGGIIAGLKRMLTGESFFINHFTAADAPGELWLAAELPGDMLTMRLQNAGKLIVQSGSFVACAPGVEMDLSWQGFKSFFSGERVFWISLSGSGEVLLSSFGAIYEVEVSGEYIVDTGHIVAFEDSLQFSITKAGASWISSMLGGEGLVCKFNGQGKVWCQSHNRGGFGGEIGPRLRPRS